MIKVSLFQGSEETGPAAVPLFGPADPYFEKVASANLLPEVATYIADLKPENNAQYVLVNAMGAGEYYGSNINGDRFSESALIHRPDRWMGLPTVDKRTAKDWSYGFPTFYRAHVFAHHRNKDASKALGTVELAAWNPHMKRVELVTRVDHDACLRFGGEGIWDKLKAGDFPDVSMGTKVPFDTCFPAGTLVRTYFGYLPIEQVQVGDLVLTHTGTSMLAVTKTLAHEVDEVLQIKVRGLPDVEATPAHPFLVLRKEQARSCKGFSSGRRVRHVPGADGFCVRCECSPDLTPSWVAAEDLCAGDYVAMPVKKQEEVLHVESSRAYLLGYYLGDGHVIRQRTGKQKRGEYRAMGVGFTVGDDYPENLERLLSCIPKASSGEPRVYDAGDGRNASIVNVYDQELAAWVQDFGGKTAAGKRLREEVFLWDDEAKLQLIGGLIDTDGSFDAAKGSVRISSSNRGLALDAQRLLLLLGIPASVGFAGNGSGYGVPCVMWNVFIPASSVTRLVGYSLKVQASDTQPGSQTFFAGGYWFAPVASVEVLQKKITVYNLSVEHDESYVVEGRAVHNCSITLDRKLYQEAWDTYVPGQHKSPGEAILEFHKKLKTKDSKGIRGLSITRVDYSEYARTMMNRILPDGRKVWVDNDFPAFFDISYVFIGADKIAKAMMKIAAGGRVFSFMGSAELADKLAAGEDVLEKQAAISQSEILKHSAGQKRAEMKKNIVPNQLAGKAVPLLTQHEEDLPPELLKTLGGSGLARALATLSGLGMVLRPREFQRVTLISIGKEDLADQLESLGQSFPKTEEKSKLPLSSDDFSPSLAQALFPLMDQRSAFGPIIERRIVVLSGSPSKSGRKATSHPSDLLRKIGAAYNGYRDSLMQLMPSAQDLIEAVALPRDVSLHKLATASATDLFTPLSFNYLTRAFFDELPIGDFGQGVVKLSGDQAHAGVQRVLPLVTTRLTQPS